MSFTLFVLMLTEAYIVHEDEIKESISRLKTIINSKKGDPKDGQQTAED
jgi:hypothetical protein